MSETNMQPKVQIAVDTSEGKEGVMSIAQAPLPYSPKALRALQHSLDLHRNLIVWHNPATNQIAIKRITQSDDDRVVTLR